MPLDDAERDRFAEIARDLARDHSDVSRVLRRRASRSPAVPVLAATAVFQVALVALSAMTGSLLPALLALPPTAVALLFLRWPSVLRMGPGPDPGR